MFNSSKEKLKIVHIISQFLKGGAQRLVLDIAEDLNSRIECEVCIICLTEDNDFRVETAKLDYFITILSEYIPSVLGRNESNVEELKKFIIDFNPDIIHTHLWQAEIVSRQIHYTKAKWFSHIHSNMQQLHKFSFFSSKSMLTNFYEKFLVEKEYKNNNNKFITISKSTNEFSNKVLPKQFQKSIYLLPNAINIRHFKNETSPILSNKLKLISIGRVNKNKNQMFLVNVVKHLIDLNINVKLQIIGNGNFFVALKAEINKCGLNSHIELLGLKEKVNEYLWNSNIYVHSAKSEALGLTLIEAMAAGLPVVTLDGGGNRDLIEQGKNGFMVYEENVELFAEKVLEIWQNKQLYYEMSNYAREYAKQYDIKPYCDNLLKLYKKV